MSEVVAVPTAKELRDTAELVFLMMKDQRTNDSFGTFYAWLTDEYRHLPVATVRNMWLHCFSEHGAMNDLQLTAYWRLYFETRRDTEQRKGQALMNSLPAYLYEVVSGTGADCFHDDFVIGAFLAFLGIPRYAAAVKVPEPVEEGSR